MTERIEERIAALAERSLLREAEAGPKPGLVDRFGPGAHADMDIGHFRLSARALGPFFGRMAAIATRTRGEELARALRAEGLAAEAAMLEATGGVNTHRGAIWSLGLLSAAAGALAAGTGHLPSGEAACLEAATLARAIVDQEPDRRLSGAAESKGLAARRAYGLRSARDEALEGFPAIVGGSLPAGRALSSGRARQAAGEDALVLTILVAVMTRLDDTCIAARGGPDALRDARRAAAAVMAAGGPAGPGGAALYDVMRKDFARRRLSPGGAADLCAATLFILELEGELTTFRPVARHLATFPRPLADAAASG